MKSLNKLTRQTVTNPTPPDSGARRHYVLFLQRARYWDPDELLERVADFTGVSYALLLSRLRAKDTCRARHLAIAALHALHPELSYSRIGMLVNRQHPSVRNSLAAVDKKYLAAFLELERKQRRARR